MPFVMVSGAEPDDIEGPAALMVPYPKPAAPLNPAWLWHRIGSKGQLAFSWHGALVPITPAALP